MIPYLMKKLLGTAEERKLNYYKGIVDKINNKACELSNLSEASFKSFVLELKEKGKGNTLYEIDSFLVDAFAAVKVVCERLKGKEYLVLGHINQWHMVPYDVQLLAATAIFKGNVAEQETGEGKTLTATLPLCAFALTGRPIFLITINEYLAQRDAEWMAPVYNALGLSVGVLKSGLSIEEKREVYKSNVIYTTASEIVFDYLREHSVVYSAKDLVQPKFFYCVIDEIDGVLVMDARMPFIISGPAEPASPEFKELNPYVAMLVKKQKDICDNIIMDAYEILDANHMTNDRSSLDSLNKVSEEVKKAIRKVWMVSKGWPDHETVKKLFEFAAIRALVDREDSYFSYEQNLVERAEALSELMLVHNHISKTFEFTDNGIEAWGDIIPGGSSDFVMLDLGEEFGKIDADNTLSKQERVDAKIDIQREEARRRDRAMCMKQLFYAHIITKRDVTYVVEDGEIVLLDEVGGRLQYGRRFSHGLHQAIEAKEGLEVQKDTQTYASITLQNFFKMFERIAGMSGTAQTHAVEFKNVYGMDVVVVPPNLPSKRIDMPDIMFVTLREKFAAIVSDVQTIHSSGRPILLGTSSVEESEFLSKKLASVNIPHQLLNAKNHKKEAEIIAMAGQKYAVTIATNMAGRGTDIKLGVGVASIGGLHVMVSSRSTSRSVDLQFRGRQGRQGDPGSCQFYVSFEDDLLRTFTTGAMKNLLESSRPPEGERMSSYLLETAVSNAQERFEFTRYQTRKNTLNYDEVINKQRDEVYKFRDSIVIEDDVMGLAEAMLHEYAVDFVRSYLKASYGMLAKIDFKAYRYALLETFPIEIDEMFFEKHYHSPSMLEEDTSDLLIGGFMKMFNRLNSGHKMLPHKIPNPNEFLRLVMLHSLDKSWKEMLENLEELRSYVHLRAIGHKDPLVEYRHEAYKMFEEWGVSMRKILAVDAFRFIIEQQAMLYSRNDINTGNLFYVFPK